LYRVELVLIYKWFLKPMKAFLLGGFFVLVYRKRFRVITPPYY